MGHAIAGYASNPHPHCERIAGLSKVPEAGESLNLRKVP